MKLPMASRIHIKVAAYTVNDLEGGESNEVTATSTMEFFEYSNPDKSYGIEAFVNRELVLTEKAGYEVALNGGDSCLLRVKTTTAETAECQLPIR